MPFNPEEDFKKLKQTGGGINRFEAYVDFMQKRKEQKEKISHLVDGLIKRIISNPELKIEDLKKYAEEKIKDIGLSGKQKEKIFKGIREYEKRSKEIKRLKEHAKSGEEIFEKFFGKPKNKVDIRFEGLVIHLYCSDEDYSKAMKKEKKPSAGAYFPSHKIISIERKSLSYGDSVRIHEEGHAIKNIFDETLQKREKNLDVNKLINKVKNADTLKDPQKREINFIKICMELIRVKEERMKDEIMAHFRGKNFSIKNIINNMEDGGYYDYFSYEKDRIRNEVEKDGSIEFLKIFKREHDRVIKNAINSYSEFLNIVHQNDVAMSYFQDIPIMYWGKELKRFKLFNPTKKF